MSCVADYAHFKPEWCPGCGNFDLLECLKQALCDLGIPQTDLIVVAGIGQASKLGFSLKCNLFDGLHGRALPVALGVKMANKDAKVLVVSGDGCSYAEGGNHFIHNVRRNLDVTMIASDNRVYGLTKGQASPTSESDFVTKMQVEGVGSKRFNPSLMALSAGATFVARSFSGNKEELTGLLTKAIEHKGFSLLDVMSPCISFNKVNTYKWFKERVKPIPEGHDPSDLEAAMHLAMDEKEHSLTGLFYQEDRPVFGDHLTAMKGEPIVKRTSGYTPDRVRILFDKFK
jgi:2-oxoglutarate/2-oxoacid ferredoxin oxidoreductase subunit beta